MTARGSIATLLVLTVLLPASARGAGESALHASFSPNRLGASTTITIAVRVRQSSGGASPLARIALSLPAGATGGFNTLGLATCGSMTLERAGPRGCSPNSVLGRGNAVVSVPIGAEAVFEPVSMSIFMAPASEGHTTMEFYARGTSPVISQLVFQGRLLGAAAPFGGEIDAIIPPIVGLPEAPAPSLVSMKVQIGPKDLRYYKRVHGIPVAYAPAGFDVPTTCPKGGFPFAAMFTFVNGSSETVQSRAPCPLGRATSKPHGPSPGRRNVMRKQQCRGPATPSPLGSPRRRLDFLPQRSLGPAQRWLSLAGVSAVALAGSTGTAAAREISLREQASLHITKRAGSNLEARGKVTGTLVGSLSLRIVVNSAERMTASFSGSSHAGTLNGRGHSSYVVSGNTLSYVGSGSISGGSGAYAHASGSGIRIEGKMNRQQGTVSMTISGRIRL